MKNTVEEIIFKIERAQRWHQWQGKRGRFVKGNPGRGFSADELSKLDPILEPDFVAREFNKFSPDMQIYYIQNLFRVKRFKKDPALVMSYLRRLFLYSFTLNDIVSKYIEANKK